MGTIPSLIDLVLMPIALLLTTMLVIAWIFAELVKE